MNFASQFIVHHLQGEICVAGSRVFVQEGIYDKFVKKLAEKAKTWTVGDPFDPTVRQGPQAKSRNFELFSSVKYFFSEDQKCTYAQSHKDAHYIWCR